MEQGMIDQLRFCAFCPNVCRFYYPGQGIPQRESMTSSALAYLGLAVLRGFVDYTKEVDTALSRLEACIACKEACPYHYNIPVGLEKLREEYQSKIVP
jgi:Fe-S oxidoreductase